MVIENPLYAELHHLLDEFYPLVVDIVNHDFSHQTLEQHGFSQELVRETLYVHDRFHHSQKTRTCGNPAFLHSFRVLLWLKILGADDRTQKLSLYHDLLEDLSSSLEAMQEEYAHLPKDISRDVFHLTNIQADIVKTLERSSSLLPKTDLLEKLSTIPLFSSMVERLSEKLPSTSLAELKKQSYGCYLSQLLEYEQSLYSTYSNSSDSSTLVPASALIVKLADRLDNTLADWPSKFSSIIKLYSKNALVLSKVSDFVRSSNNPLLKLVFILLIERSLDQIAFLIKNYTIISEKRGVFYGEQYKKLLGQLHAENEKLLPFAAVRDELLEDGSVRKYVDALLKK